MQAKVRVLLSVWLASVATLWVVAGCQHTNGGALQDKADASPTGASPEVVACGRGVACPDGQRCDPFQGCVQCLFDSECGSSERCIDRKCEAAVMCSKSGDCAAAGGASPVCDTLAGRCVECLEDASCKDHQHCVDRKCQAYPSCINSFDCSNGLVCNRERGECVQCATQGDCVQGQVCATNRCVRACDGDNDCRDLNQLCDVAGGHCAECVKNVDCPEVYHCLADSCVLDICKGGSTRCDAKQQALVSCSKDGDAVLSSPCPSGTACSSDGLGTACDKWVCTPGVSTCNQTNTKVVKCAADGLSEGSTELCGAGQTCALGKCVAQVCTPSTTFCQGGSLATCSADGTSILTQTPCSFGSFCDPTQNACVPQKCVPGTLSCDGSSVAPCNADGSGFDPGTPCDAGQTCMLGACQTVVCTPGQISCGSDKNVHRCNDSGTAESISQTCSTSIFNSQVCDDTDGTPACKTISCTAGTPLCDVDVLTQCNATGTGPLKTGGTDCTSTNQVCTSAACKDVVCTGTSFCKGGDVYSCSNRGTTSSLLQDCTPTQYCKPGSTGTSATCVNQLCTPGQKGCDGSTAAICNTDGSGWNAGGTDCTASNSACVNGTCLPVICTANSRFCQSGNVYQCGSQGVSSALYQTCSAAYFCNASTPGSAYCAFDVCTAGSPICRADFVTTCQADGSGPEATGGTNCAASGQACDTGVCKAVVCTKGKLYCKAGNVEQCNVTGTASSLNQTCQPAQYCADTGTTASCNPDVCTAAAMACSGETATTCNADGSGYVAGGTNCGASAKVCNELGQCATSAVDTIGGVGQTYAASSSFVGNQLTVRTSRKLTNIEQYLNVPGTSIFTWLVYESSTLGGPSTKIFEQTTSGTASATFVNSGAISVALQAGKYYVVGVMVSGSFSYAYTSTVNQNVSFAQVPFGAVVSMTTAPVTYSFSSYYYSTYQRLTTTL